jgi:hypothetical protein
VLRFETDAGEARYVAGSRFGVAYAPAIEGPWTLALELDDGGAAVNAGPRDAPTRLLLGTSSELYLSEDDGVSWAPVLSVEPPQLFTKAQVADDGTCLAVTTVGRVYIARDGVTWTDLGIQLPSLVHDARVRPDFAEHPELLVATHDGVYVVRATEPVEVERWGNVQRVDNLSAFLHCETCPAEEPRGYSEAYEGASTTPT